MAKGLAGPTLYIRKETSICSWNGIGRLVEINIWSTSPLETTAMALVARSMTRSEVVQNNDAQKAVQKEWTKLREKEYYEEIDGEKVKKKGVWGLKTSAT